MIDTTHLTLKLHGSPLKITQLKLWTAVFGVMENVEKDNEKSEDEAVEINAQQ